MILASVIVIAATVYLLLSFESSARLAQLRSQGGSVSRILADIPFEELKTRQQDYGPLRILQLGQNADDFAYAVVVSKTGQILNAVNSPSVDVVGLVGNTQAGAWSGEREVTVIDSSANVLEFFSPIVDGNAVVGTVRVGYFVPKPGLTASQLPIVATMALIIFLLTPLFYFVVRREIKPVKAINAEISSRLNDGGLNACTVEATGEFGEFITRFNEFSDVMRARINSLEHDNGDLVTSQKLLSYRKNRIDAVLQAIPEAILILNEDGRVSYANKNVLTILGAEPQAIMNKLPSEWCPDEQALEILRRFETTNSSNFYADTQRLSMPNAAVKKLSIKAYPLFAPNDPETFLGKMIVLRDISKEALAEEGRTDFIAHVSHELKSPLNTLALYSEALQGDQGKDEAFRVEAYNVIHDETERLASLVDNLLNITKIEVGNLKIEKQRVRLHDLLHDAFDQATYRGKTKNLRFKVDLPPELSAVTVDKELLRIAINNLLVNAVKYTPDNGGVLLAAVETDSAIEIRVTDSGIGIPPEDQAKIFDKFYRSESDAVRQISGHGLGLSLAREIVELHGGTLTVRSVVGKGSEFLISLRKDRGLVRQAI